MGLAVAAALPCAGMAHAEDKDVSLAPVSVTATKTQKLVSEAPASVSVVTDRQIESRSVERIDDALRNTTGVYIKANGDGTPSNYDNQILLRGVPGYYRTGIMVDGQSISNGFSQGANTSTVPVDNIEQIEVVPGPFSALYGGSAMGGVVNIITKAPTKREVILRGGFGSNQTHSESGTYRDRWKFTRFDLGMVTNLDHSASQGYIQDYVTKTPTGNSANAVTGWERTESTTGGTAFLVGDKGRKGWTKDNLGVKFFLEPDSDTKITAEAAYHESYTIFDHGNTYLRDANGNTVPSGTASTGVSLSGTGASTTVQSGNFLAGPTGEEVQRYKLGYEGKPFGDATLKLTAGHMRNGYWYVTPNAAATDYSGTGTYTDIPNNRLDGDAQLGMPIGGQHYLIAGLNTSQAVLDKHTYTMDSWREDGRLGRVTGEANGETLTKAAYFQDEIAVTDALTIYAGARYDTWTTSGSTRQFTGTITSSSYEERSKGALSPKLSTVYRLGPTTTVRAAAGKAFRTPSLSDMYSTFTSTNSNIYWASPDLRPEKARMWEVGGEHGFASGTTIKGTYFSSQIKDLIYSYKVGTNNYKTNAGGAHIQGIEAELRQRLIGGLTAFANLTVQDSFITSNAVVPSSVGKRVTYMPDRMWNIGVEGDYKDLFGSLTAQHISKVFATNDSTDTAEGVQGAYDEYTVFNAKLGWHITPAYSATLSINNLLDEEYFVSSAQPGRTFFLGLKAVY